MLKTYWEALRGLHRTSALCVLLAAFAGLSEALGLAALIPLLSGSLSPDTEVQALGGLSGRSLIVASLIAVTGLATLSAGLRYAADVQLVSLTQRLEEALRGRMLEALLRTRYSTYLHLSLGDSVKLVLSQGAQVAAGAHAFITALGSLVVALAFVLTAAFLSLPMTAATLVFGAVTGLSYRAAGRRAQRVSELLSVRAGEVADVVTDVLSSHKYYRSTGRVDRALLAARGSFRSWREEAVRTQRYGPLARAATDVASVGFLGGVLAVNLLLVEGNPVEALVFLALFYRLAPRLQALQQSALQARAQLPWWHAWQDRYISCLGSVDDSTGTRSVGPSPRVSAQAVTHRYETTSEPAVDGVDFELSSGSCLALVGESGSGKTTLVDLVTGLLRPTSGAILLDGVPLGEHDVDAWQRRIGLVMQQTPIFFDTVLANIAWTDEVPDLDRAWTAAKAASLATVIERLPDGMDTMLGQQGGRLSGGQRQRLALARALYTEPSLLILDEATSALDAESEHAVQVSLSQLKGQLSMLVVAHRLSTVRIADHILVMSQGRVVEQGDWNSLLALNGTFARMVALQSGSGDRATLGPVSDVATP